jgi:hypothetical protein
MILMENKNQTKNKLLPVARALNFSFAFTYHLVEHSFMQAKFTAKNVSKTM